MIDDKHGKEHDPLHGTEYTDFLPDLLGRLRCRSKSTLMVRRLCHASCSISPRCLFGLHANKHSNDLTFVVVECDFQLEIEETGSMKIEQFSIPRAALMERRLFERRLITRDNKSFLITIRFQMNDEIDNVCYVEFFVHDFSMELFYYNYVILNQFTYYNSN